jgi:hypothetical protein
MMTIHVNKNAYQPPMNLNIVDGSYRSTYVKNPIGGYQEPSVINVKNYDHRNGHLLKPNMVAFKYPYFKEDDDLNVHVRVFNFVVKANAKTLKNISSMHLTIC